MNHNKEPSFTMYEIKKLIDSYIKIHYDITESSPSCDFEVGCCEGARFVRMLLERWGE